MAYLDQVSISGVTYNVQDTKTQAGVASVFSASQAYAAGDYVWYDDGTGAKLYCFNTAHAAGAWVGTDASVAVVTNNLSDLKSALEKTITAAVSWEQGGISVGSGGPSNTLVRIRTNKIPINDLYSVRVNSGYGINIFCYDGSTYRGWWDGYLLRTTGSPVDGQFTGALDLIPLKNNGAVKQIIITLGVYQDTTTNVVPDEGENASILCGYVWDSIDKVNKDIDNIYQDEAFDGVWVTGSISIATGTPNTTAVRIKTHLLDIDRLNKITIESGYGINIFCYDSTLTYKGCWYNGNFSTSGNSADYQYQGTVNLSELKANGTVKNISIVLGKYHDTTTTVALSDYVNVKFVGGILDAQIAEVNSKIDAQIAEVNSKIDTQIAEVNDEIDNLQENVSRIEYFTDWAQGGISASTGSASSTQARIRTSKIDRANLPQIFVDQGYGAVLFCYDESDTYLGMWTSAMLSKTVPPMAVQFTGFIDTTELPVNVNYIVLVLGKYHDSTTNVIPAEGVHAKKIYGYLETNSYPAYSNPGKVGICHKGYNMIAPENSIPAYSLAKRMGFTYVECDVRFTLDGVAVLSHNDAINSVAKNADGSDMASTVNISETNYNDLLDYDFGIIKGEKYRGLKICTFDGFMKCCSALSLIPRIDVKAFPENVVSTLYNIAKNNHMERNTEWSFVTLERYQELIQIDEYSCITYGVSSYDATTFDAIASLKTGKNRVNVSLSYSYLSNDIINGCKDRGLTCGVWTLNSDTAILALDSYVRFVSSDFLNVSEIMYNKYISA